MSLYQAIFDECVVMIYGGNPDAASSLSLMLERSGHLVHQLAFGKASSSKVVRLKPDAVLLIGLPDADAHRLASELRKKISRRARIIAISLFDRKVDEEKKGDFDHYFMIPGDEEDLLVAIEKGPRKRDAAASPSSLPLHKGPPRLLRVCYW